MMFRVYFLVLSIAVTCINLSCNYSPINNPDNYKPDKVTCLSFITEKIYIPANWSVLPQKHFLLFSRLNSADSNAFLVVFKKDIKEGITPNAYLKESYKALMNDTVELATGYTVKKVLIENKTVYRCEYFTKIRGVEYIAYSLLFTNDEHFYDVTLKTKLKDGPRDLLDFNYIIFNMEVNEEKYFKEWYLVNKEETIDISKL